MIKACNMLSEHEFLYYVLAQELNGWQSPFLAFKLYLFNSCKLQILKKKMQFK